MTKKPNMIEKVASNRNDIATETWLSVVRAYNECTTTLALQLEPFGISVLEHEVLMNLLASPRLMQRDISERCFSAKSGISVIITHFERDGLVQRERSKKDNRAWEISLTERGQTLAQQLATTQLGVVLGMAKPYTDRELLSLTERMHQSSRQMQKMRGDQ